MWQKMSVVLAAGVVFGAVIPARAAGKGGSGPSQSSHHSHHHDYYHHGHYYHRYYGYPYYGVWPYGYYAYDNSPAVFSTDWNEGSVVSAEYESEEPPPAPPRSVATVRVQTAPAAKLWFDGVVTSQTGPVRTFSTPPLDYGKAYSYQVKACWLEDGRPVVRSQTVQVSPGQTANLDLR